MTQRLGRAAQLDLFPRSKQSAIDIDPNHRLVRVTEELDWSELEALVQSIRKRKRKLKSNAGRPPRLRALIGALVFRALRRMPYRETEDQIRHYAPARYLCGLTECEWTPDANTIQDFEQLLGEDGVREINEYVVRHAVAKKVADPTVIAADTTAQEASIPYPNEMRLMATFVSAVAVTSRRVGSTVREFVQRTGKIFQNTKQKLRAFRLFAKNKSKTTRLKLMAEMARMVGSVQKRLACALRTASRKRMRLTRSRKVAWKTLNHLTRTMSTLLPQIRHWIRTGFVAPNKIVSLQIPEISAVVRGKVGKPIEFGLNWGITGLRGGCQAALLPAFNAPFPFCS